MQEHVRWRRVEVHRRHRSPRPYREKTPGEQGRLRHEQGDGKCLHEFIRYVEGGSDPSPERIILGENLPRRMITAGRSMSRWRIAVVASVVSLGAVAVWLARDTSPPSPRGGGIPPGSVVVPDLAGLEGTALRRVLHGVGLRLEGVRLVGGSEPLGTLVRQRPSAGTVVPEGSGVVVTLSTRGPGYTIGCPVLTGLVLAGEGDEPRVLRFVRRYLRAERRPSPDRAFLWRTLDPYGRAVLSEDGVPRPGTRPVTPEFRSFGVSEAVPLTRLGRLNGGLWWQLRRAGLARACDRDERRVLATATWWVPVDYPDCPCVSGGQADWLVVRRTTGFRILAQT